MAKKRNIIISLFKHTVDGSQIKARVDFTLKMFEGDTAQEHTMNLDLLLPKGKLEALAANTVVIDIQKRLRELGTHAKVREYLSTPVTYDRAYPGRGSGVVTKRDMTPQEIREKAKNDPAYRAELMAQLAAMQDEIDNNGN